MKNTWMTTAYLQQKANERWSEAGLPGDVIVREIMGDAVALAWDYREGESRVRQVWRPYPGTLNEPGVLDECLISAKDWVKGYLAGDDDCLSG